MLLIEIKLESVIVNPGASLASVVLLDYFYSAQEREKNAEFCQAAQ